MSVGLYSHTTRATGTILTAAIYNADHQNHITNHNPAMVGALSDTLAEYQAMTDPGGVGSEVLAANLAGEIERLRFCIDRIVGGAQWYSAPSGDLSAAYQPLDSDLTAIAAVVTTAYGRAFLALANQAALAALLSAAVVSPILKNFGETVNNIGPTGGGTQDISLADGNVVLATVNASANTFTFSGELASGINVGFKLYLTNGGSQVVNWPAEVIWAAGAEPDLTVSGVDVLVFETNDGGAIWHGFVAGLAMS